MRAYESFGVWELIKKIVGLGAYLEHWWFESLFRGLVFWELIQKIGFLGAYLKDWFI